MFERLRELLSGRRKSMDARFEEEMQHHLQNHADRSMKAGVSPAEARRRALAAFGGSQQAREDTRDVYRSRLLHDLRQDAAYALRTLRRAPGFAAAVLLSLALGIGATTVIFSVADHIVLRPLPYPNAERLVAIREHIAEFAGVSHGANASHFLEWERQCTRCERIAAIRPLEGVTLTPNDGEPEPIGAVRISPSLFPLLGVSPAIGRPFVAADDQPGSDAVILTDGFWRRRFGADPNLVGRTIALNGRARTVVGVLPRNFWFPKGRELGTAGAIPDPVDVFVPLALDARERTTPGEYDYGVVARMAPGATPAHVRAQIAAVETIMAQRSPDKLTLVADVIPLHEHVVGPASKALVLLLAAVGAVLLIVCVNLANLMLARNAARLRESAVRVALGAARLRLTRQALTESLVLALAGGALGVLFSRWGLSLLLAVAPSDLPRLNEVHLDARVLLVSLTMTLLAGVAFGTLPALRFSRADPAEALKSGSRGSTDSAGHARGRSALIASQTAFSTILLVTAGLFLSSFIRVLRVDKGFEVERVLAVDVIVPRPAFTSATAEQYFSEALRRIATLPGVTATGVATKLPLEGESQVDNLAMEHDTRPGAQQPTANIRKVSAGYFRLLGTPLIRGRDFTEADRGRSVVVLSERAAKAVLPGEDPIGKRIIPGSNDPVAEVIGIVADVKTSSLERDGSLVAYLPYWQRTWPTASILVRTSGDPAAITAAVRAELRGLDARAQVRGARTMSQIMSAAVAQRRFQLALLTLFAAAALATASIGIYGIIAHALSRRRGEIGIRMALGARPWDVERLVLREGLRPVIVGLLIGIVAAIGLGRTFASLLFEVRPADPLTLNAVVILLASVAVIACLIPARRATRLSAVAILRLE